MNKPISINIENELVYLADELYKYDTLFFTGCTRVRLIIVKKKLSENDYIFAYKKGNIWIKSTSTYPKAKLCLKEEWTITNVPKMMDIIKQELYKYEQLPEILQLEDREKFHDKNGKILNIEVRGDRKVNKCYFKVKDISTFFEMPNLQKVLSSNDNTYEKIIDYNIFTETKVINTNVTHGKKYLFMTYEGMIKLLYISRNENARYFRRWATETLFTIQLGQEEDKQILSSNLLGVNVKTIKDVFKTNTGKTPCVYLYLINNANTLLEGNYDKDDLLCKYGCTDDLERRCGELDKKYTKEFNSKIELLCFSIIESKYIFNAETNITKYFKSDIIEYQNTKELIIINKKNLCQIKQHFGMIQHSYIGRYEEMHTKISQLEKNIIELNTNIILNNEKHKNAIKDKDIEILQYKIKFLELHNKL